MIKNPIEHKILKFLKKVNDRSPYDDKNKILNLISRSVTMQQLLGEMVGRRDRFEVALELLQINGDIIIHSKKCEDFHVNYQITEPGIKSYLNKSYAGNDLHSVPLNLLDLIKTILDLFSMLTILVNIKVEILLNFDLDLFPGLFYFLLSVISYL